MSRVLDLLSPIHSFPRPLLVKVTLEVCQSYRGAVAGRGAVEMLHMQNACRYTPAKARWA